MLIAMILVAHFALLLFAVLPNNLKVAAIFLNGLPLGMVWGLVVRYLEGRRTSELLLAGLSCSFIIASGMVKDVGRWMMNVQQVDQFWMPFVTGVIFLPPFLLSVWLLLGLAWPSVRPCSVCSCPPLLVPEPNVNVWGQTGVKSYHNKMQTDQNKFVTSSPKDDEMRFIRV